MEILERQRRWRLLLGHEAGFQAGYEPVHEDARMDATLKALYDDTTRFSYEGAGSGGEFETSPVSKWMSDIRSCFPEEVLNFIQNDVINRSDMEKVIFEPEVLRTVVPDVDFAAFLLRQKAKIPQASREIARRLIEMVVEEISRRIEPELQNAVTQSVKRRYHSTVASASAIDWHTTIRRNLGHYDKQRRVLIPERFTFLARGQKHIPWRFIILLDQSASMASSAIYTAVAGSVFSTLPAIRTQIIAFGTRVSDITEHCTDPVELLMELPFGGGTDIGQALAYCTDQLVDPTRTMILLVSDLFEGGSEAGFLGQARTLTDQGVTLVCLTAFNDTGRARYDGAMAKKLADIGAICVEATPESLPPFLEAVLSGQPLQKE